ncbi:MAG TPA: hypothetical protein VNM38_07515 [Solirubrobacterales bacterium]|nr:hypothetical protein [Solirubrobacterales bacterium]
MPSFEVARELSLEDAPEEVDRKQDEDDDDQDRDDAHCSPLSQEFGSAASSPGRRWVKLLDLEDSSQLRIASKSR